MSHRTTDLPPLSGLARQVRELRYHEFSRQALGLLLIVIYGLVGRPTRAVFYLAVPVIGVGILVRLYASGFITKNQELATEGPYALVRHPLYTGNVLILLGFSIATGLWWCWLMSGLFLWFYYPAAIEYEDRKLRAIFGASWERWRERVPALIPSLRYWRRLHAGEWSFMKSLRQNLEPVIALFLLFWAWFLWNKV